METLPETLSFISHRTRSVYERICVVQEREGLRTKENRGRGGASLRVGESASAATCLNARVCILTLTPPPSVVLFAAANIPAEDSPRWRRGRSPSPRRNEAIDPKNVGLVVTDR